MKTKTSVNGFKLHHALRLINTSVSDIIQCTCQTVLVLISHI